MHVAGSQCSECGDIFRREQKVITLILGGGKGTRLLPLTEKRSKPAVSFGGKYRLIDIPISNALNSQFNQIYVLTQFNSYSLNRHISRTYNFNTIHNKGFVEVIAAEQTIASVKWFEGTADAVRKVLPHIRDYAPKYIIILSGDQLYNMNLELFLRNHILCEAEISIAANSVSPDRASELGILKLDENGLIQEFYEKPKDLTMVESYKTPTGNFLASMGIYIFNTEVLIEVLQDHSKTDFGKEIIPHSLSNHKVYGYAYEGYWEDIGTIKAFYEANLMLTDDFPKFNLYLENTPFFTRPRFLPPTKVNKANLTKTLLSEGCIINDSTIIRSVIGVRQVIDAGCYIENTVIMGADSYGSFDRMGKKIPVGIGQNCEIRNAIIDKDCYIGKGVKLLNKDGHINFEDEHVRIVDGIIVVPRRSVIPDNYEI
ncbi:MAG: glucose-1-phosphate adenylyltransferase [Leptospiraceae bacterium]|nr:glucose-1-phosphate adenylyltransferase [Leptospiraceae bacterium]NUM42194.1 glucose-1-phosphate adenylyltransferase [Leptospiraceae bacterium]